MEEKCQIKVLCSLFTRILLVKDAQSLNRTFNGHINSIFKMQVNGELFLADKANIALYLLMPIISCNEHRIIFDLNKSLYDAAITRHTDKTIHNEKYVQSLAETAIHNYIFSSLSGVLDEEQMKLNQLAIETLQEIQDMVNENTAGA